jgi:hypothetical protein
LWAFLKTVFIFRFDAVENLIEQLRTFQGNLQEKLFYRLFFAPVNT